MIELNRITYRRNNTEILSKVSWTVGAGEHWAVLGPNGSGKTSLLNVIMGYEWPSEGSVSVLGHRYGRADLREVRKSIGWVSAKLSEWHAVHHGHGRAVDLIAAGLNGEIGSYRKREGSELSHAYELIEEWGLAHLAERPYRVLSQGEQQRVLLARAWMSRPKILILDEPCSGLDLSMRELLLNQVQKMSQNPLGPTLIYVSHHIDEIMPGFTHAMLLKKGEILAQGKKEDILSSKMLSDLFDLALSVRWSRDRAWVAVES